VERAGGDEVGGGAGARRRGVEAGPGRDAVPASRGEEVELGDRGDGERHLGERQDVVAAVAEHAGAPAVGDDEVDAGAGAEPGPLVVLAERVDGEGWEVVELEVPDAAEGVAHDLRLPAPLRLEREVGELSPADPARPRVGPAARDAVG